MTRRRRVRIHLTKMWLHGWTESPLTLVVAEEEEEDLPLEMMGMAVDPQVMMEVGKAVVVADSEGGLRASLVVPPKKNKRKEKRRRDERNAERRNKRGRSKERKRRKTSKDKVKKEKRVSDRKKKKERKRRRSSESSSSRSSSETGSLERLYGKETKKFDTLAEVDCFKED